MESNTWYYKELTIEQKAKRYDEILARAKGANLPYYKEDVMSKVKEFVDYLLPELKESEDERIRKEIIDLVEKQMPKSENKKWMLAWLEKQDPKKHEEELENAYKCADEVQYRRGYEAAQREFEKQSEQKPEIKYIYPKFRVGDVIEPTKPNGHYVPVRVKYIGEGAYSCESDDRTAFLSLPICDENDYVLAEQKPAELNENEKIRQELIRAFSVTADKRDHEIYGNGITYGQVLDWLEKQGEKKSQGKSALEVWKGMRLEIYQQASGNRHEPNYSDDSTKMFSLTDIDEIIDKIDEKQGEQKPAWSEEDEEMTKCVLISLEFFENLGKDVTGHPHPNYFKVKHKIYPNSVRNWLKSLKQRMKGE